VANRRVALSFTFLLAVAICAAFLFATPVLTPGQGDGRYPGLEEVDRSGRSPSLEEVDGGPDYYKRFSSPLPHRASYFPIGTWLHTALSQSDVATDKDVGLNLYAGVADPEGSNLGLLRANQQNAFIQADERTRFTGVGHETAGWLLADEIDMTEGPAACNGSLETIKNGLPRDGRARYNNYGKGVLLWETDAEAACFVEAQQLVSSDLYWFTDPNQRDMIGEPWLPEGERQMTLAEVRRAANYGYQIDRMRALDAGDGERKPIWAFVEVGWPFTETAAEGGRAIQPDEIRGAVWHSIIAGARGILYFDHQFSGPCTDRVLRGPCYPANSAMVKSVNHQIKHLAPVLNAPTLTSGWTANPSIRAMVKWRGGHFYVFAGSRNNVSSTGRVSIPCVGDAKAVRLGEAGSVPMSGGSFTDSFADGNAVHIYRIDGGSTCGLGFRLGKVKRNLKQGTAKLTVEVPGPGALRLKTNSRVRGVSKHPAKAGRVRLKVRPRGSAGRKLKRTSKTKVKAKVRYTPSGGEPSEKSKRVTLKRRHGRR
jgi:hypothetical protein